MSRAARHLGGREQSATRGADAFLASVRALREAPCGGCRRYSPTADKKELQKTGDLRRNHVNVQRPGKHQVRRCGNSVRLGLWVIGSLALHQPAPLEWSLSRRAPAGFRCSIRPLHFPGLFALGALNAWSGQVAGAYGAVPAGLCVCVCAASLFGEDLLHAVAVATRLSSHSWRHTPELQLGTWFVQLGYPSALQREILTASRMTVCWCLSRTVRSRLCAHTGRPPDGEPRGRWIHPMRRAT